MKLLYHIMCLLLMAPALCHAQDRVGYAYDAAGNRISRTIILSRNMAKKQARTMKDKEYTDILSQRNITISPNPTKGMVKITITGLRVSDDCAMSVYTLKGQTLKTLSVSRRSNGDGAEMILRNTRSSGYVIPMALKADMPSANKLE